MPKKLLTFLFLSLVCICAKAQLKSPEDFLGYKIGTRFTPHWKIVNYFNHVAANAGAVMKLQQYGETNEGRPLLLAFISSAANIADLENIRKNNLRLAGLGPDKNVGLSTEASAKVGDENMPVIVWLSYNVHGNEPSSSEAAMLTLFALADPNNTSTKEWLKNTVVIIDPCLNPDGRDRYVNWYNSAVGKNFNPQPLAREHREPWPQGRTNHYNFDLNRDWAWQTQVESRQRVKVYQQWMPEVHVDFHEQEINTPYYFAPAAEPFHEVITTWQRDFQNTIGKNNAKYFDQKGWLFFTREQFDLFYPSYGDTYPLYNGSIGMTYEQAGIGAGLGIETDEGDTLTLWDRAQHHFTTSLSTVEVASANAKKLTREFSKYFKDAITNGAGEYKTYVIKNEGKDGQRIDKMLELLDKNGIQYGSGSGTIKGYNYNTGREENYSIGSGDIVITAYQPRSALLKVLFEPKSKLADSVTYDITAWAIPYSYGLTAFASRDRINVNKKPEKSVVSNTETTYGYVMPWLGVRTVRAAGQMMKKGVLLRYAESPFEINGNKFDRGSIIILKTGNKASGDYLWNIVTSIANANNVELYPVYTGMVDKGFDFGSDRVHPLKAPRIILITGDAIGSSGAGGIWSFFEQELDYPVTQIQANDIQRINWNDVDVMIMPDGNYRFLNDKETTDAFKNWINQGGRVVALEGALAQLSKAEIGFKTKKTSDDEKKDSSEYDALKKFEDREREAVSGTTPGSIYKVELDNTNPLAFGYPNYYYTLKQDDVVYDFLLDGGWNVGVIKKDNQVAGFVGAKLKDKLKDGLLFGVKNIGDGTITGFADNVLFRDFWENGKLMFCNAVFLVGQ